MTDKLTDGWDASVDPTRVALEALITKGDKMSDYLEKMERKMAALQSKLGKQRNEIARLTQLNEKLMAEKAKLLADLKWMRGEV